MSALTIVIVNKNGDLEDTNLKKYDEADLYKKCGFKKNENFDKRHTWSTKLDGTQYKVSLYAKDVGKANTENKYEFPPPVDKMLYYGKCALVLMNSDNEEINLNKDLWNNIYEKLFGGFHDLAVVAQADEEEVDELDEVPSSMKTKAGGYLKDGFVIDNDSEGDCECDDEEEEYNTTDNMSNESSSKYYSDNEENNFADEGSELSEEEYIFSDDE